MAVSSQSTPIVKDLKALATERLSYKARLTPTQNTEVLLSL